MSKMTICIDTCGQVTSCCQPKEADAELGIHVHNKKSEHVHDTVHLYWND